MPTQHPRISVSFQPEDFELLRQVAHIQGVSVASILREYVEMSRPMLQHMVQIAAQLEDVKEGRRVVHQEALHRAMGHMEAVMDVVTSQLPAFQRSLDTVGVAISPPLPVDQGTPNSLTGGSGLEDRFKVPECGQVSKGARK